MPTKNTQKKFVCQQKKTLIIDDRCEWENLLLRGLKVRHSKTKSFIKCVYLQMTSYFVIFLAF